MGTPGKEAYKRETFKGDSKPAYPRKKAAMSGSDARSAYRRKRQDVSSTSRRLRNKLRQGV